MDGPREKQTLKTVKKKGITINPKKEDLMKETYRSSITTNLESLKEAAKKKTKEKHKAAAKAGKRWQDSDGDGKWYEPGEDVAVKKEETETTIDTTEATKLAEDRLRQRMIQKTMDCLLYTSPSPRDQRGSRMPSSA